MLFRPIPDLQHYCIRKNLLSFLTEIDVNAGHPHICAVTTSLVYRLVGAALTKEKRLVRGIPSLFV